MLTLEALPSHLDCSNLESKASNTTLREVVIFKQNKYFLLLFSSMVPPRRSKSSVGLPLGCEEAKMNILEPQRTQNRLFHTAMMVPCSSLTFKAQAS